MTRPAKAALPMRDGVSASCVALPAGAWPLVLDFLSERLPRIPREEWRARLERGDVHDAQGQPLPPDAPCSRFQAGARLYYYRQWDAEPIVPFEAQIVFQDAFLLVADKPHFLPVIPGGRYVQQTLLTRLKRATGIATLTPIHRIDRETAGLVLFSIRPQDRNAYQALFRERAVEKVYEAVAPFRQDLTLPMVRRSRLQERADAFMQMEEVPGEPNAETLILLIAQRGDTARYALQPRSGQKHQLRAHMSALALPIRGDRIYPVLQAEEATPDFSNPLQLLSREIAFADPVSGGMRRFVSGLRLAAL